MPLNVGAPSLMVVNPAGMSDDVGGDLTRDEVRSVIETFWRLDADKAHLADFRRSLDDEFVIGPSARPARRWSVSTGWRA